LDSETPSAEDPQSPKLVKTRHAWIWGSLVSVCCLALGLVLGLWLLAPEPKAVPPASVEKGLEPQTEAIFLNNVKNSTAEWSSARADHRLVAYTVFNCKQLADAKQPSDAKRLSSITIDVMPRHVFSTLLLDLTPSGHHNSRFAQIWR
jgi:hypothetical protein